MAGDIATALLVPPATLSFHLKELVQAGLVESESQGRHEQGVLGHDDVGEVVRATKFRSNPCVAGGRPITC